MTPSNISGTEQAQAVNVALTPCPFCGGKPVLRRIVEEYEADSDGPAGEFDARFMICCDTCGIETGEEYRTEAISAWNRRAVPSLPQDVAKLIAEYRPSMPTEVLHLWAEDAKAALTAQSSTIASAREVIDGLLKALKVVEFRSYEPGEATDDEKTIRFEARPVVVAAREWQGR